MKTLSVYKAAGGSAGLLRLARAWHSRVMADEVVGHAFSHGFHPQHDERLAAYWGRGPWGSSLVFSCLRGRDLGGADSQLQRRTRGDGPAGDRLLRPGSAGRGPRSKPVGPTGLARLLLARLLRLGDYDDHVAVSRLSRRCARRHEHSALVMGRAATVSMDGAAHGVAIPWSPEAIHPI